MFAPAIIPGQATPQTHTHTHSAVGGVQFIKVEGVEASSVPKYFTDRFVIGVWRRGDSLENVSSQLINN